ncbi:MAG TPA: hypothetical protein VK911_05690 [Vicinamibacterales bacterium]|nr:hypothetical protein [Vicinamibacterales bacterium]
MSTRTTEIWVYSGTGWGETADITGYKVEAIDGSIGKIDRATYETNSSYVVVDTGPWIFGKKVLLPAGVIARIDPNDEKVYVNRTKDEIKNAPEFDEDRFDEAYRNELGTYYGRGGRGYREHSVR